MGLSISQALGIVEVTKRVRTCLRAWIGFHDQIVMAWLADRSISEAEVLEWTMRQLDHLAADVLGVDLDRRIADKAS